jgi:hypothetical protein
MSPTQKTRGQHLLTLSPRTKKAVINWLEHIKMPLGKLGPKDEVKKWGVLSHHNARGEANMHYFLQLMKSIPKWPWEFNSTAGDVLLPEPAFNRKHTYSLPNNNGGIMMYAGSATEDSTPEEVLQAEPNAGVMLTYYDIYKKHGCTVKRIEQLKKRKKKDLR